MKKILYIILALNFVTACASLGPKFDGLITPNKDETIIYIYRPNSFVGAGINYYVKDGQEKIVRVYNGGYYPYITNEGNKTLSAKTEVTKNIELKTKNGEVYFVKAGVTMGLLVGRPSLKEVSKEEALKEITNCKLLPKDNK